MARRTTLRRRYGRSGVDPAGEYAAHQRRMRVFVTAVSGGVREYVPNSAIPGGVVGGHGIWRYWTRPAGGAPLSPPAATAADGRARPSGPRRA